MAPRVKNVKSNEKRQSMASDGSRLIQTRSLVGNPPPFKYPTTTPPIRQNLALNFRQFFLRFYTFLDVYLLKWHLLYIKIIRKIQGNLFHKNHSSLLDIKEKYTRTMSNPSPETPPPSFIHWII
jgi:hypothetical protein